MPCEKDKSGDGTADGEYVVSSLCTTKRFDLINLSLYRQETVVNRATDSKIVLLILQIQVDGIMGCPMYSIEYVVSLLLKYRVTIPPAEIWGSGWHGGSPSACILDRV